MKNALALLLICLALPVRADSDDQNRAREAVERHEILPLAKILRNIRRQYGRNIVDIEFEDHKGQYFYEFEIIDSKGQIVEILVDAATGKVAGNEGTQD